MNPNGSFQNGTGVGNETASEHEMYRKFMIDSLTYWVTEYKIDGFRFDLMGIHDVDTMMKSVKPWTRLIHGFSFMEKVGIWGQDWLQKIRPKRTMLIKWPKSVSLMIPLEMP